MKLLRTLSLLAAGAFVLAPVTSFAAEKKGTATAAAKDPAAKEAPDSARPIPYTGTVTKVDEAGKSFTLKGKAGRVITVTDATTITKDGQPSTLSAIKEGEEVHGSATKSGENWTAVKVMIGAKETAKKEGKAKGGATQPKGGTPAGGGGAAAPAGGDAGTAGGAMPAGGDAGKK